MSYLGKRFWNDNLKHVARQSRAQHNTILKNLSIIFHMPSDRRMICISIFTERGFNSMHWMKLSRTWIQHSPMFDSIDDIDSMWMKIIVIISPRPVLANDSISRGIAPIPVEFYVLCCIHRKKCFMCSSHRIYIRRRKTTFMIFPWLKYSQMGEQS